MAGLARMLDDSRCRLVTVVGPGGIGKTRLVIEAASVQQEFFADGVRFVSLVSIPSPHLVVPAIADALGLVFSGVADPQVQLLSYLRDKTMLLVLDSFEHLLDAGSLLALILQQSPGVKLLVTSRERLDLHGEWLFDLQGLPVPTLDDVDCAEEYSAVGLFVQTAQRVHAGYALRPEDRLAVSRICRLVEGMPLAIELAAAWIRLLACDEIASEIERSLDFLASTTRDVPKRHQSLRAVFDHSWNLLADDERSVLCRLAVFHGDFTAREAAQVAGASLHTLSALVSKSLVHRSGNGRYDLHAVVRQYARSRLAEGPESQATRDLHCHIYLELLRDRERALRGAAQQETLRELTGEIGNVRAAWSWAVGREEFELLGQAMRCLAWLHEMRGWFHEGIEQIDLVVRALRARPDDTGRQALLGQALAQQGLLLFRQGQFARAQSLFEESLSILRPLDDPALLLDALTFSAIILFLHGDLARAQSRTEQCLASATAADEPWFRAYALYNQGYIASLLGRYEEGYEQMLAGLAGWRALGDPRHTALGLNYISPTATQLGHHQEAQAYLEEGLMLCTQAGDRWGMGTAYRHLGLLALAQGRLLEAEALIHKSLDLFDGFISGWDVAQSLVYLGQTVAAAGDTSRARLIYVKTIRVAMEAQAIPLVHDALVGLADLQAGTGEPEQALSLALCVLSHPASLHEARARAENLRIAQEALLSRQRAESASGRAETPTLDETVGRVLARVP